jgi:hypothetical protein
MHIQSDPLATDQHGEITGVLFNLTTVNTSTAAGGKGINI